MHYSIEPRHRIYLKGYGFLSFAKNIGTNANKVAESMSNKYSQKLFDSAKKSTTDAIKTASKRAIQKTAGATGDLIDNKIAHKIISISKSPKEFPSQNASKEFKNIQKEFKNRGELNRNTKRNRNISRKKTTNC